MDNNLRNNSGGVINPSMMNGNGNNSISPDSKKVNKNAKVTLDKNGKPKRKKASRGKTCSVGEQGGIDLCV
jgi:hypothetical protein